MILVTGATGLIGSHLLYSLLSRGEQVIALKRPQSVVTNTLEVFNYYSEKGQQLFDKINWAEGDINDVFSVREVMVNITEVYHCAGLVSFNNKDYKKLMRVNAEGTANLVNAALECGVQKFCHVSSVASIPNPDNLPVVDETVTWKSSPSHSAYALSKYGAEREVWRAAEEGLNVVIVNPSVVLGSGCWQHSSGKLIASAHKGMLFYTKGKTGYVDVRDLVKSMLHLMQNNCFKNRYIINSENLSYKEVLTMLHRAFKKPEPKIKAGSLLLHLALAADALRSKFSHQPRSLTKPIVSAALNTNTYSNKKIKETTGISFTPISETINYLSRCYLSAQ